MRYIIKTFFIFLILFSSIKNNFANGKAAGETCANSGQCASGQCGPEKLCTVTVGSPCAYVNGAPTCYAGKQIVCDGFNGTAGSGTCRAK